MKNIFYTKASVFFLFLAIFSLLFSHSFLTSFFLTILLEYRKWTDWPFSWRNGLYAVLVCAFVQYPTLRSVEEEGAGRNYFRKNKEEKRTTTLTAKESSRAKRDGAVGQFVEWSRRLGRTTVRFLRNSNSQRTGLDFLQQPDWLLARPFIRRSVRSLARLLPEPETASLLTIVDLWWLVYVAASPAVAQRSASFFSLTTINYIV